MNDAEKVNICRYILDDLYGNPAEGESEKNAALINVGRMTFALNCINRVLCYGIKTEEEE